ncbi:MAG: HAD family phosphatase [Eubacteriales bacterium]|nr:HAD family phosphatase [Eubacteriales bacterium]
MIDTVVFDIGGVLAEWNPEKGMRAMGFSEETIQVLMEKIFRAIWLSCDEKRYTEDGIRAYFKSVVPGYEKEVDVIWDELPKISTEFPYSCDWIRELKARGKKVYLLSNYNNISFEKNSVNYHFLSLVDGRVVSYELEAVKPSPVIFEHLLKKYDIDPEKAVFLDDNKDNIAGAIRMGMKGIVFSSYEQARAELEQYL